MVGKETLRPIGTVFKHEVPPSFCCTETRWSRITYKVVGHVLFATDRDGGEEMGEELKCLDIEYFEKPNCYMVFKDGAFIYEGEQKQGAHNRPK